MAGKLRSPELIRTTRFAICVPKDTSWRFSVLHFPYRDALSRFMETLSNIYKRQNGGEYLPYVSKPSYRQLNDGFLTFGPGLIQAFEPLVEGWDDGPSRMVAFTRYRNGQAVDFPSLLQITSLIRSWLHQWSGRPEIQAIVKGEGKAAWQTMQAALNRKSETEWEHDIHPADLASNLKGHAGLAFIGLPALVAALLHGKEMVVQSDVSGQSNGNPNAYRVKWRRVNGTGKDNLYLVSQPIERDGDLFAYSLNFSVHTQAGHIDAANEDRAWLFAHLGIQRYIAGPFRGDSYRRNGATRNMSVLVGLNRDRFVGAWDDTDTTLVRLSVNGTSWDSGVGELLDSFSFTRLANPSDFLGDPRNYGAYGASASGDEYYVVYAEGRTFGEKKNGRKHRIFTGTSLKERGSIIAGVLQLLEGWLESSEPLRRDPQNTDKTLALRDYDHMVQTRKGGSLSERASWRNALETSLANGGWTYLHIAILHRSDRFKSWASAQVTEALMGVDGGNAPLTTVSFTPIPATLYMPLATSETKENPLSQSKWRSQVNESRQKKLADWQTFLGGVPWTPNARRLVLIDSTGEAEIKKPEYKIKGIIREACHRESISSQFLIGVVNNAEKKRDERIGLLPEKADDPVSGPDGGSSGKIKNAVLDLLLRQQGILYAPPHEVYCAAGMDPAMASQLDVVAFCNVQKNTPKFHYALAIRLRANGEVDVMLHGEKSWESYDAASHSLSAIFSSERLKFTPRNTRQSPLRLEEADLRNFAHDVLINHLERPTIAVIEAAVWRNGRGKDQRKHGWTQLRNPDMRKYKDELNFGVLGSQRRDAPGMENLLAVVRLRMGYETPQYITADDWTPEVGMRDIPHLTGYVDPLPNELFHYFSVGGLPETQKRQKAEKVSGLFKGDTPETKWDDIAFKHPQLVELVPFYVHPRFQSDAGLRQLCRCVHLLRISPGFTMGDITLPYPMHLGEKLIDDKLTIINADD